MLYGALLHANTQELSYGQWITSSIKNANRFLRISIKGKTPYFSGIRNQLVFGRDDVFLSVLEFSQRKDWPELSIDELNKLYTIFRRKINVPHSRGYAAFGRSFLTKDAHTRAIDALKIAAAQAGGSPSEILVPLIRAQCCAGDYPAALETFDRFDLQTDPVKEAEMKELKSLLGKLAAERKHALLVGIDSYQNTKVPRLKGARNDVAVIKSLLSRYWGFRLEDIIELTDSRATRDSILSQFKHLAETGRQGTAVFFFAGRGSHDLQGVPAIVPYDGRQNDIPDISLAELADLASKTSFNLITILDSSFQVRR